MSLESKWGNKRKEEREGEKRWEFRVEESEKEEKYRLWILFFLLFEWYYY